MKKSKKSKKSLNKKRKERLLSKLKYPVKREMKYNKVRNILKVNCRMQFHLKKLTILNDRRIHILRSALFSSSACFLHSMETLSFHAAR